MSFRNYCWYYFPKFFFSCNCYCLFFFCVRNCSCYFFDTVINSTAIAIANTDLKRSIVRTSDIIFDRIKCAIGEFTMCIWCYQCEFYSGPDNNYVVIGIACSFALLKLPSFVRRNSSLLLQVLFSLCYNSRNVI